ncbi:MAG: hypothetical protein QOJ80_446 [Mycobacterium sp.]|jgi:hypothetical protein|nr:hypothetical protein [Mycobacterium sp.]
MSRPMRIGNASEFGVYWPTLVPAHAVEHAVIHHDGQCDKLVA